MNKAIEKILVYEYGDSLPSGNLHRGVSEEINEFVLAEIQKLEMPFFNGIPYYNASDVIELFVQWKAPARPSLSELNGKRSEPRREQAHPPCLAR